MLQSLFTNVAIVVHKCCMNVLIMLQGICSNVASLSTYVAINVNRCRINVFCMLHNIFHLRVAFVAVKMHVAGVLFKCFNRS
jgi:hypothetical protein